MEVLARAAAVREPQRAATAQGLRELHTDAPFRAAPVGDDQQPRRGAGIRAVEFPTWFVCQNPACRALVRAWHGLERKGDHYLHRCDDRKAGAFCVPVRFVAACARGHLEEFPWVRFAHQDRAEGICEHPRLTLDEGASGDFAEIWVRCRSCRASESAVEGARAGHGGGCNGERPWLGEEGNEPGCPEMLQPARAHGERRVLRAGRERAVDSAR
jgi:hypothetical protein